MLLTPPQETTTNSNSALPVSPIPPAAPPSNTDKRVAKILSLCVDVETHYMLDEEVAGLCFVLEPNTRQRRAAEEAALLRVVQSVPPADCDSYDFWVDMI